MLLEQRRLVGSGNCEGRWHGRNQVAQPVHAAAFDIDAAQHGGLHCLLGGVEQGMGLCGALDIAAKEDHPAGPQEA